ncbi:hypothetical protein PHIN109289_02610 [Phaeobacter inhibens]
MPFVVLCSTIVSPFGHSAPERGVGQCRLSTFRMYFATFLVSFLYFDCGTPGLKGLVLGISAQSDVVP